MHTSFWKETKNPPTKQTKKHQKELKSRQIKIQGGICSKLHVSGVGCACALVAAPCSFFSLPHAYGWVRSQGSYRSPSLDSRPLPRQAHLSGALAGHHEPHLASSSSLEECCSKVQILLLMLSSDSPLFPNPFTISQVSIWPSISNTDKILFTLPCDFYWHQRNSLWVTSPAPNDGMSE